jgi:hypothetical protein
MDETKINPKAIVVSSILENETYTPDSGLYQRLALVLNRLPLGDLENLALLVSLKETEAAQKATENVTSYPG